MGNARLQSLYDALNARHETTSLMKALVHPDDYEIVVDDSRIPQWWSANNNFMLCRKGRARTAIPNVHLHPNEDKCSNYILFCNDEQDYGLLLWGDGGLLYLSPHATVTGATIALGSGCIVAGPKVRHTARLELNCRNGGRIVLKEDILIASDVSIQTDDCHTLFTVADGRRRNPFGGSVWIDDHVWIGQEAIVMGDSRIERNSVVGARSFVRGSGFPPNAVLAGSPARAVTTGIDWDYRDFPPDTDMRAVPR